jgi:hypothetical protein
MKRFTLNKWRVHVRRNWIIFAVLGGFVVWGVIALCVEKFGSGGYGDAFGPVTGLATATALIFAMLALKLQRKELRAQRLELGLHRDEFRHQTGALRDQSAQTEKHVVEAQKATEVMAKQSEHTHRLAEEFKRSADFQQTLVEDSHRRQEADRRLRYLADLGAGLDVVLEVLGVAEDAAHDDRESKANNWSEYDRYVDELVRVRGGIEDELDSTRSDPDSGPHENFDLNSHLQTARRVHRDIKLRQKEASRRVVHSSSAQVEPTPALVQEIIHEANSLLEQMMNVPASDGRIFRGGLGLPTERRKARSLLEISEQKLVELKTARWSQDVRLPHSPRYDVVKAFKALARWKKALREYRAACHDLQQTDQHESHPSAIQCREFVAMAEGLAGRVLSLSPPQHANDAAFDIESKQLRLWAIRKLDEARTAWDAHTSHQTASNLQVADWLADFRALEQRVERLEGLRP